MRVHAKRIGSMKPVIPHCLEAINPGDESRLADELDAIGKKMETAARATLEAISICKSVAELLDQILEANRRHIEFFKTSLTLPEQDIEMANIKVIIGPLASGAGYVDPDKPVQAGSELQ